MHEKNIERLIKRIGDRFEDIEINEMLDCRSENTYIRVLAKYPSIDFVIKKPATRWDYVKMALPSCLRRWFPVRYKNQHETIGIPADIPLKKIGAITTMHTELVDDFNAGEEDISYGVVWGLAESLLYEVENREFGIYL